MLDAEQREELTPKSNPSAPQTPFLSSSLPRRSQHPSSRANIGHDVFPAASKQ
jgi:hypothetical protein